MPIITHDDGIYNIPANGPQGERGVEVMTILGTHDAIIIDHWSVAIYSIPADGHPGER